jgi:flagellar protein FliO/FliZ
MSFQLVLASLGSVAASAEKSAAPSSVATLASMVGGLIVVLLLIFALAYMVKRLNLVPSSQGVLKTIAVTPLGQKEKLVLVEVDGQQYLLGVTPHQVNLVDKLTTPVELPKDSFASRLRQAKSSQ